MWNEDEWRDPRWWRDKHWWREEAWKYPAVAFTSAFIVFIGRSIWLDYPLDSGEARDWIGALSGYVAAIGALLAAWLTIPHLRKQVSEAQRQNDFTVGDAPPEIEVKAGRWQRGNVDLQIVNWNRRAFTITMIEIVDLDGGLKPTGGHIGRGSDPPAADETFEFGREFKPLTLAGWRNRSKAPDAATVQAWIHGEKDDLPWVKSVTIRVHGNLGGIKTTVEDDFAVQVRRN